MPASGKTDAEIVEALNAGIGYFNIESEAGAGEPHPAGEAARRPNATAKAALRVNPDVEYKTHAYLTTGKKETKFGVDIERAVAVFDKYGSNRSVRLCAIHVHLGTGGKTIDPYVEAVQKILPLIDRLRSKGHSDRSSGPGRRLRRRLRDRDRAFGGRICRGDRSSAQRQEPQAHPRARQEHLLPTPAILLTRVLYTKQGGSKKFVIVDAGMNDLIRPSLYDAFHFIWPAKVEAAIRPDGAQQDLHVEGGEVVDVVGPICEGADFFAKDRAMPPVQRGDLLCGLHRRRLRLHDEQQLQRPAPCRRSPRRRRPILGHPQTRNLRRPGRPGEIIRCSWPVIRASSSRPKPEAKRRDLFR